MQTDSQSSPSVFRITPAMFSEIDRQWLSLGPLSACLSVLVRHFPDAFRGVSLDHNKVKERGIYHFRMAPVSHQDPYFIQRVWLMAIEDQCNTGHQTFRFYYETIDPWIGSTKSAG